MSENVDIQSLKKLCASFEARYRSYAQLKGLENKGRAKAAKRAWLELRKLLEQP